MDKENRALYQSPIGMLLMKSAENCITGLSFLEDETEIHALERNPGDSALRQCAQELDEYFQGTRKYFDIKINNAGTGFRRKTWSELIKIPYGSTMTYKELAIAVGNPNAVRAVGGANNHNNIAIIVPCHRVIGSNGKMVGYGGCVWRKEWLLAHEQKHR